MERLALKFILAFCSDVTPTTLYTILAIALTPLLVWTLSNCVRLARDPNIYREN
jgi:hypothetical protein